MSHGRHGTRGYETPEVFLNGLTYKLLQCTSVTNSNNADQFTKQS